MCIITGGNKKKITEREKMSTLGNYLAIGILVVITLVFLRNRYYITKATRWFGVCIIFTYLTAITNSMRTYVINSTSSSDTLTKFVLTFDILFSLLTTSVVALYLISKVTEHALKEKSDFLRGKIVIGSLYVVFTIIVLLNLKFGYIFTVTDGVYSLGKFVSLPYVFMIPQMLMVLICCIVHKRSLSPNVRVSLILCLPVIAFCALAKTIYNDASVFVIALVLVELLFFLSFQNRKINTNTLTNLNDGRSFYADVAKRIKTGKKFKAYLIKLNNIGSIKENHGYRVGDELLYHFGVLLRRIYLATPFHMYGTTFALISSYTSEEASEVQTDELIALLNSKITYKGTDYELAYSVSEHVWEDEATSDAFYEKLEYAVSTARAEKKKHQKCTLDLEIARLRKKYLINRMETISEEAGYEIWFQPIYSVRKGAFSSAEILIRLKEQNGTYVSPAEFIPLAEKTGQIIPLTWFVIESTCKAMAQNHELDGMRASINLPMLQLVAPDFEERLNRIVDGYGIPHERISFEFTERVILDDLAPAQKNMSSLYESGYSFYLDDFGTGYSNFNVLFNLPLKTVKLDMSLTAPSENPRRSDLAKILTDFFHGMGLGVVAEGAETIDQVEYLKEIGVDGIQGYYFAKPMPLNKLKCFLKKAAKAKEASEAN